ncbi:glycine zipper 2TM domain-containing protein [Paraburkholderia sp. MM5482-R1]|uniref:glycine zipper 2TM domain-containing protein n=1 Tax=unclassified Paraburkholderia TaxID=2615204 RepID=UPI003D2226CD
MNATLKSSTFALACAATLALLAGCQATGEQYSASTYTTAQLNSRQEVKTVEIIAILPAKVQVDNAQGKQAAQIVGGLLGAIAGGAAATAATHGGHAIKQQNAILGVAGGAAAGAAAGSLVSDKVLVDGVQLTYKDAGKVFSSTQVGKACEFTQGIAEVVSTGPNETRVQPNAACPTTTAAK